MHMFFTRVNKEINLFCDDTNSLAFTVRLQSSSMAVRRTIKRSRDRGSRAIWLSGFKENHNGVCWVWCLRFIRLFPYGSSSWRKFRDSRECSLFWMCYEIWILHSNLKIKDACWLITVSPGVWKSVSAVSSVGKEPWNLRSFLWPELSSVLKVLTLDNLTPRL